MTETLWVIVACGVLAIAYSAYTITVVMKADPGSARMQEIASAIRAGKDIGAILKCDEVLQKKGKEIFVPQVRATEGMTPKDSIT